MQVMDKEKGALLWKYSTQVTGAEWQPERQPKSPCPTLKVISAVTAILDTKEQLQRQQPKSMRALLGV